ncbi:MAG: SH3 domain-containing protein [Rhizobiaceae bacterium]
MRKAFLAALSAVVVFLAPIASGPAAAQYCEGTVHGLSSRYNAATGAGFLAVRAGPRRSAAQVGELYNRDKVEIFDRRGNWYKVAALDGSTEGWASARYIWNDCDY